MLAFFLVQTGFVACCFSMFFLFCLRGFAMLLFSFFWPRVSLLIMGLSWFVYLLTFPFTEVFLLKKRPGITMTLIDPESRGPF